MTREEAVRIMSLIATPHRVLPDAELLRVWFDTALHNCGYDTAVRIAHQLNANCTYMPKPAQFNELKRMAMRPERGRVLPEATGSWSEDSARTGLAQARAVLANTKGVELPDIDSDKEAQHDQ